MSLYWCTKYAKIVRSRKTPNNVRNPDGYDVESYSGNINVKNK